VMVARKGQGAEYESQGMSHPIAVYGWRARCVALIVLALPDFINIDEISPESAYPHKDPFLPFAVLGSGILAGVPGGRRSLLLAVSTNPIGWKIFCGLFFYEIQRSASPRRTPIHAPSRNTVSPGMEWVTAWFSRLVDFTV